jgi:hypothetical protein
MLQLSQGLDRLRVEHPQVYAETLELLASDITEDAGRITDELFFACRRVPRGTL